MWALRIRRLITFSISFVVLFAGWAVIIFLSIYENDMQDYLKPYNSFLASWVPTALVTVVNFIVPEILSRITEWEHWDFSST